MTMPNVLANGPGHFPDADELMENFDYLEALFGGVTTLGTERPSFLVRNSSGDADITGDGTEATVIWDGEIYDLGGDFASNVFTAPIAGQYLFIAHIRLDTTSSTTGLQIGIRTSNRIYFDYSSWGSSARTTYSALQICVIADMDANDTAYVTAYADGLTKVVDLSADPTANFFSGTKIN